MTSPELTYLAASRGSRGPAAKRVQEWLVLHGAKLAIDGAFGPATATALTNFQASSGLPPSGDLDGATWQALIAPMMRALAPVDTANLHLRDVVVKVAERHLAESPREVGGANAGPWCRLYTSKDGPPWCAGFATFVLEQAAEACGAKLPWAPSLSCDTIAQRAQRVGLLVPGGTRVPKPGWLYLVRTSEPGKRYHHTGIVVGVPSGAEITEISGNTNTDGSREGVGVFRRKRGTAHLDYIEVP